MRPLDPDAETIKAYLATATKAPVYDHDEAQMLGAGLPAQYTVIYLSPRPGGPDRGGSRDTNLRRLQTRPTAKTVTNVRLLETRIFDAFEHKTVTLGDTFAHFAYEAGGGSYQRDDLGYYSDLTDWLAAF